MHALEASPEVYVPVFSPTICSVKYLETSERNLSKVTFIPTFIPSVTEIGLKLVWLRHSRNGWYG